MRIRRTSNSAGSTTAAAVINKDGIALDDAVKAQVAAEASIGDFTILQRLDGDLDSIYGRASRSHDGHCRFACTVYPQLPVAHQNGHVYSLVASLQVVSFVLLAVKTSTSMYKDGCGIVRLASFGILRGRAWREHLGVFLREHVLVECRRWA